MMLSPSAANGSLSRHDYVLMASLSSHAQLPIFVIPAKAGTHSASRDSYVLMASLSSHAQLPIFVIPAKAGTQSVSAAVGKGLSEPALDTPIAVAMGPCFRRDDAKIRDDENM
jgi:hypothetical protein